MHNLIMGQRVAVILINRGGGQKHFRSTPPPHNFKCNIPYLNVCMC